MGGVDAPEQGGEPPLPALEDAGQPAVQRQEQGPEPLAEAQQRERDLTLRQQATSIMHLLTHLPKNPHCETCQRAKMRNKQTPDRSKRPSDLPSQEAKAFGEKLTADHTFARSINDCGMGGEEVILVVRDIFTKWIEAYPLKSKDTSEALRALRDYMGAAKGESFHSDDSPELKAAAREMGWAHTLATPGRPETNGVAERTVGLVCEGARALLLHAGLHPRFWPWAIRYFCFAYNITRSVEGKPSDEADEGGLEIGSSPWTKRHGVAFKGPLIPFGCLVDMKPSAARVGKQTAKFEAKTMPGIFLGYLVQPGGRWVGDFAVAPFAPLGGCKLEEQWKAASVHKIKEVYYNKDKAAEFPLKPIHDLETRLVDKEVLGLLDELDKRRGNRDERRRKRGKRERGGKKEK